MDRLSDVSITIRLNLVKWFQSRRLITLKIDYTNKIFFLDVDKNETRTIWVPLSICMERQIINIIQQGRII